MPSPLFLLLSSGGWSDGGLSDYCSMRKPFHLETQIKLLYQTTLNSVHEMSVIYTPSCDSEVLCYLQMTSVSPVVFLSGRGFLFRWFCHSCLPIWRTEMDHPQGDRGWRGGKGLVCVCVCVRKPVTAGLSALMGCWPPSRNEGRVLIHQQHVHVSSWPPLPAGSDQEPRLDTVLLMSLSTLFSTPLLFIVSGCT